jgi:hypothetical protein
MTPLWVQRQAALLRDCIVSPDVFASLVDRLCDFVVPSQHGLETEAGKRHLHLYVIGLLSHLDRKNAEKIATFVDVERLVIQACIGTAPWDHRPLIKVLVGQVVEQLGEPDGVIAFDPSSFPKRGTHSVGVKRQWCSHRGKVDNCQVGIFMGYVSRHDHALLDFRLSLPEEWARDAHRRQACHVPEEVHYHTRQEQCLEMLDLWGEQVPHSWVMGDDELGRHTWFRQQLRTRGERYVRGAPCTTVIRDLEAPLPAYQGRGRPPKPPWQSVTVWRKALHSGGVSNVDIDGNNALQIKAIGVVISTFETLPARATLLEGRAADRVRNRAPGCSPPPRRSCLALANALQSPGARRSVGPGGSPLAQDRDTWRDSARSPAT